MAIMSALTNFTENSIQNLPALVVVTDFPLRWPASTFISDLYLLTLIGLIPKHTFPCKTITMYTPCTTYIQCWRRRDAIITVNKYNNNHKHNIIILTCVTNHATQYQLKQCDRQTLLMGQLFGNPSISKAIWISLDDFTSSSCLQPSLLPDSFIKSFWPLNSTWKSCNSIKLG